MRRFLFIVSFAKCNSDTGEEKEGCRKGCMLSLRHPKSGIARFSIGYKNHNDRVLLINVISFFFFFKRHLYLALFLDLEN